MTQKYYKGMAYLEVDKLWRLARNEKTPQIKRVKVLHILRILLRDEFKCVSCGSKDFLTIDHFKHGGTNKDFGNLGVLRNFFRYKDFEKCKTLCVDCHLEKNKVVMESLNGRGGN